MYHLVHLQQPLRGSSVNFPAFIGNQGSNDSSHVATVSAWEVEAGGSQICGLLGLHSESFFIRQKQMKKSIHLLDMNLV